MSAQTGKPIKGALVYVVAGEEEALTKDNGVFKITTSQKTPVTVTAEHQQYHTGRISITDTRQQIIVRLKAK
ncbi:MAG: carboxypeptidase-like regulatory domain-containing protein [Chitinophagaceae bacterium]|nr:carboxypeptidase-like regulatory domain-containing protein [Chitinophagaceae bacterium]